MAPATPKHPVVLLIMDGWGVRAEKNGNAIAAARKPFFDLLWKNYPHAVLGASGTAVGLPPGYIGNSEVGHTHIGAGRSVPQELMRINKAIHDGSFFRNRVFLGAIRHAKRYKANLHIMGLVSDGGVHSHISHLFALLKLAKRHGMKGRTFVHCFLDGRDVPPKCASSYLHHLETFMRREDIGEIATISGRYYAMDRDNRWQRTRKAYLAMTGKTFAYRYAGALAALQAGYTRHETDEFVQPSVIHCPRHDSIHPISDKDAILFFNFRADRARQLTRAFMERPFAKFQRKQLGNLCFVCMTRYDKKIRTPVAFPPFTPRNTLGELVARHGLRQLRIAETEKYAHVTYFFNNGLERPFPREDRVLIPSPKVATYDTTPAMSAFKITKRAIAALRKKRYHFIVINFANPDMVGHTGKFSAVIKAIEIIDACLRDIVTAVLAMDGSCVITADHGNAEEKADVHQTSHTINPVPCAIVTKEKHRIRPKGSLQNIAPTILRLLGLPKSREMTLSLIIDK